MIQVLVKTGAQLLLEGWMHYGPLYQVHEMTTTSSSQNEEAKHREQSWLSLMTLKFAFVALVFQATVTSNDTLSVRHSVLYEGM